MNPKFFTTLYRSIPERIAAKLRVEIAAKHVAGDRLPTVLELAQRFDVSAHSITSALEIIFGEGLIEKSPGRGIRVAERRRPQRAVGIVSEYDFLHSDGSPYFRSLAYHVRRLLREEGVSSQFYIGHSLPGEKPEEPTCEAFLSALGSDAFSGLVVLTAPDKQAWREIFQSNSLSVVGVNSDCKALLDYPAIVRAGLKSLRAEGCRRVALLGWGQSVPSEIFASEARELGLETSPALIRHDLHPDEPGSGWEEFREIWTATQDKPDGLLITDDALLPDVAASIGELGICVPEQLRVVTMTHGQSYGFIPFPITMLDIDTAAAAGILVGHLLHKMGLRDSPPPSSDIPFTVRPARPPTVFRCDITRNNFKLIL